MACWIVRRQTSETASLQVIHHAQPIIHPSMTLSLVFGLPPTRRHVLDHRTLTTTLHLGRTSLGQKAGMQHIGIRLLGVREPNHERTRLSIHCRMNPALVGLAFLIGKLLLVLLSSVVDGITRHVDRTIRKIRHLYSFVRVLLVCEVESLGLEPRGEASFYAAQQRTFRLGTTLLLVSDS